MKKIISVVGARPNFMKVAPIHKAFEKYRDNVVHLICHTGQHYDEKMSKIFFEELELPKPDFYLGVGSGTHAEQTARVMIEFEKVVMKEHPDLVIVYGDVNSTVACSIVSSKLGIKIAHVEAGLRSFDRSMPEEINRIVTDTLSDLLFVTEMSGNENLSKEGIDGKKIHFVGNVMIDSLKHYLCKSENSSIFSTLGIQKGQYILLTLHRPSNVDSKESIVEIINTLNTISKHCHIVFPIHPRTRKNVEGCGMIDAVGGNIILTEPLGYIDFIALIRDSRLVITDSGGIQEETTYLKVPCITARENTERPITVEIGTNRLLGTDWQKIGEAAVAVLGGEIKDGRIPDLWDGHASERIATILNDYI